MENTAKTETTPKNLNGITKDFMLSFMKDKTADEKEWFKKLCADCVEEQVNNVTKKTSTAVNVKKVRRAFAEKYFPEIVTPQEEEGQDLP